MFVCSPKPDNFKLSPLLIEKLQVDMDKCMKNLSYIQNNQKQIEKTVQSIYKKDPEREMSNDIDQSLYDNFVSNKDRKICNHIQSLSSNEIGLLNPRL